MKADKKLAKEVLDFVLWLTPCGQIKPAPTVETIGREARKLNRKIALHIKRNKPKGAK